MHEMHLQGLIEDNLHCDCPYEHVDQGLIFLHLKLLFLAYTNNFIRKSLA